jgi:hypothetical protein
MEKAQGLPPLFPFAVIIIAALHAGGVIENILGILKGNPVLFSIFPVFFIVPWGGELDPKRLKK